MSTERAVTQLVRSKDRISASIEAIKSKCEKKILMCENEIKQIDRALEVLSGNEVAQVRKLAL